MLIPLLNPRFADGAAYGVVDGDMVESAAVLAVVDTVEVALNRRLDSRHHIEIGARLDVGESLRQYTAVAPDFRKAPCVVAYRYDARRAA